MKYDFLIVGAGLFGATCCRELTKKGYKCLVIDKRDHVAGNVYTKEVEGVIVHVYGAHIFHTSDKGVWDYVNSFAHFNDYINTPIADYHGERYHLPFNMNTFRELWGVQTAEDAKAIIDRQVKAAGITEPKNLEEQAISMVGTDIYQKLIKGYTEKQWGRDCKDLPSFIIKRLPLRFTFDNNYFNDPYQGIPVGGYTQIVNEMLCGADVELGVDFIENRRSLSARADRIIYTGQIDRLFGYKLGKLEYRSLKFETEVLDVSDYQGNAVVNYTAREVPYTRIIEHKHFEFGKQKKTVVTREYPKTWEAGDEPYYPVNDEVNNDLAARYARLAEEEGMIVGGRLADYKYYDMDKVILSALNLTQKL